MALRFLCEIDVRLPSPQNTFLSHEAERERMREHIPNLQTTQRGYFLKLADRQ